MKKKTGFLTLAVLIFALALATMAQAAEVTVLYSFGSGGANDGIYPYGAPVLYDGKLYGTTAAGGSASNSGEIFSYDISTSTYAIEHAFSASSGGQWPYGNLVMSTDGNFYGTTYYGGTGMQGVVFSFDPVTKDVTTVHDFYGGSGDGINPFGTLTLYDGKLFGMTYGGGVVGAGTIFSMNADVSVWDNLHDFDGSDALTPYGNLIGSGDTLYGMTYASATTYGGAIFSINTDGTGYQVLRELDWLDSGVGVNPFGDLFMGPDGLLYGMTSATLSGAGNVFSYDPDTDTFTQLHEFTGWSNDGGTPQFGSLTFTADGRLLGTTSAGGASGAGTIFSLNTDGTGFALLHSFAGGTLDGASPQTSTLILDAGKIYGLTSSGGASGKGVLFSTQYTTPEPATVVSGLLGLFGLAGKRLLKRKKSKA